MEYMLKPAESLNEVLYYQGKEYWNSVKETFKPGFKKFSEFMNKRPFGGTSNRTLLLMLSGAYLTIDSIVRSYHGSWTETVAGLVTLVGAIGSDLFDYAVKNDNIVEKKNK